ncbi:unnamed protein product [Ilex paraguariensis]|uniref:Uncharacterized protein n=1 Tax=Ilex paraguariensis TaxID=185542 RepID=A0ABC8SXY5_9AQUA
MFWKGFSKSLQTSQHTNKLLFELKAISCPLYISPNCYSCLICKYNACTVRLLLSKPMAIFKKNSGNVMQEIHHVIPTGPRNVYRKPESDLQSSKKRLVELVEESDALKKGREESDEQEEALDDLKAIEQKYNELKGKMGQYADNDPVAFEAMS